MPVIGWLQEVPIVADLSAAFQRGMAELGYVEGNNFAVEYRPRPFGSKAITCSLRVRRRGTATVAAEALKHGHCVGSRRARGTGKPIAHARVCHESHSPTHSRTRFQAYRPRFQHRAADALDRDSAARSLLPSIRSTGSVILSAFRSPCERRGSPVYRNSELTKVNLRLKGVTIR
jgi:hypothetical protein